MKKLMVVAFVAVIAAVAQAGTVAWTSGALMTAKTADGGWSSSSVVNAQALVTMNVYLVDADTYSSYSDVNSYAAYEWAKEQTADYSATNAKSGGGYNGSISATTTDLAASTKYYSIVVATYSDATLKKDYYMTKGVEFQTAANGSKTNGNLFGTATTAVKNWQAVPEPTSGLLLLLGMAGLALRRRRA